MKMKYTYNKNNMPKGVDKNEYLHIVEAFDISAKPAPVKQIPMRLAPKTLEPISEETLSDIKFYNGVY